MLVVSDAKHDKRSEVQVADNDPGMSYSNRDSIAATFKSREDSQKYEVSADMLRRASPNALEDVAVIVITQPGACKLCSSNSSRTHTTASPSVAIQRLAPILHATTSTPVPCAIYS